MGDLADKDRRGDHDRDTPPPPVHDQKPPSKAARTAANGGADAAARGEMSWGDRARAWANDAYDAAHKKTIYEDNFKVNDVIRLASTLGIADVSVLAATDATNIVHVRVDMLGGTLDVTAPRLDLAASEQSGIAASSGRLLGLSLHLTTSGVSGTIGTAQLDGVTFVDGDRALAARRVTLVGAKLAKVADFHSLRAAAIRIDGIEYPGMPPINLAFADTTLRAVLPEVITPPSKSSALPEGPGKLMPAGSRIDVSVVGLTGNVERGAMVAGQGGFKEANIRLVGADNAELAGVTIRDFRAAGTSGATTAAGATIGTVLVTGTPELVYAMLGNAAVQERFDIKPAVELIQRVGLGAHDGARIMLSNLSAEVNAGGAHVVRGNFQAELELESLGRLELQILDLAQTTTGGTSDLDFRSLSAWLYDDKHNKELARLEVGGTHADLTSGAKATNIPLRATGDIKALLGAMSKIPGPPAGLDAALRALKGLGIQGTVEANLAVEASSGGMHALGDVAASIDVAGVGKVAIDVDQLKGTSDGDVTFDRFAARLMTTKGAVAASFTVRGVGGRATKQHSAFHADGIEMTGTADQIGKLLGAIEKNAAGLPANLGKAFKTIRALAIKGGGKLTADDVTLEEAGGRVSVGMADVHGAFAVKGVGTVKVALHGFDADYKAKNIAFDFDSFVATLHDAKGAEAVKLVVGKVTKGKANLDKGTASGVPSVRIDGHGEQIGTLVGAIKDNLKSLPAAIGDALAAVEEYAPLAGDASITATGLKLDKKSGELAGHGDLSARVATGDATIVAKLSGVDATAEHVDFKSLHVDILDKQNASVASLDALAGKVGTDGKTGHIGNLAVRGDAVAINKLLSDAQRGLLPPMIGKALGLVDSATITASVNQLDLDRTDGTKVKGTAAVTATAKKGDDTIRATLLGLQGEGAEATFESLEVAITDKSGEIARLHVTGARAALDKTSASAQTISASGDGMRLRMLLERDVQDLLPASIAGVLAKLDHAAFTAAANDTRFASKAAGDEITVAQLQLVANVRYADGGTTYTVPQAHITARGAKVVLGPDQRPRTVDAEGLTVEGPIQRETASDSIDGRARITTGPAHVAFTSGEIALVRASNVSVSGEAMRTAVQTPAPTDKQGMLAAHDDATMTRLDVAKRIEHADVHVKVPLNPGVYGRHWLKHARILEGTTIDATVKVANGTLTEARVQVQPAADAIAWVTGQGAYLEPVGGGKAKIIAELGGMIDLNASNWLYGDMSMNLEKLIEEWQADGRASLLAEDLAETAAKTKADTDWLREERAEWSRESADRQRGKTGDELAAQRSKDAADEPRSARVNDLFTPAISMNLPGITGSASATVKGLGSFAGVFQGGLRAQLTSGAIATEVGGGTLTTGNIHTGEGGIAVEPRAAGIAGTIKNLMLDSVTWQAPPKQGETK